MSEALLIDEVIGDSQTVNGSTGAQMSTASQNRCCGCLSAHLPFLQLVGSSVLAAALRCLVGEGLGKS